MTAGRDEGSGTVLALAVVGAVLVLFGLLVPLGAVLAASRQAAAAADAAALAAADTAIGFVDGFPCDRAAVVALADGAELASCRQRGTDVRVRVRVVVLGLAVTQDAVAGQPR